MADPGVIALAADLTGQTRLSDADWNKVEVTAQTLANSLRVKNSARFSFSFNSLTVKTLHRRRYTDSVGSHTAARCSGSDNQRRPTRLAGTRCLSSPRFVRDPSCWGKCLCRSWCDWHLLHSSHPVTIHRREQRPPPRLGLPPCTRHPTRALYRPHPP